MKKEDFVSGYTNLEHIKCKKKTDRKQEYCMILLVYGIETKKYIQPENCGGGEKRFRSKGKILHFYRMNEKLKSAYEHISNDFNVQYKNLSLYQLK